MTPPWRRRSTESRQPGGIRRLLPVAETLAADPETAFAGALTGDHNLLTVVVCRDAPALLDYLTQRLARIDGIDHLETIPITAYTKRFAPAG